MESDVPRKMVDELTASQVKKEVEQIKSIGASKMIRVGGVGGLGLSVRRRRYDGFSHSWVLRRTVPGTGKRRDFALGGWPEVTLSMARERARIVLDRMWRDEDPLPKRRVAVEVRTFRKAAEEHFKRSVMGRINPKDERVWLNDIEEFVYPVIGDMAVSDVETRHIVEIAERPHVRYGATEAVRLWDSVPDRAQRCIAKVRAIFDAETAHGHRDGPNPADWKHKLKPILGEPKKRKRHQPSLPYDQLPAFIAALREREPSTSHRALELLILTGVRSREACGARWDEIDMEAGVWTIPAERMKAKKEHRVPLSSAAMAVLKAQPRHAATDLIFPGPTNKPLSGVLPAVRRMHKASIKAGGPGWVDPASGDMVVPHGFRATFRVWAEEQTAYPRELAEMALAHTVGNEVERAYRRTDALEKRRELMEDWAGHTLSGVEPGLGAVG